MTTRNPTDLPEQGRKALIILRGMVQEASAPLYPNGSGIRCALVDTWRKRCVERGDLAKAGADKKTHVQAFRRAVRTLQENGLIEVSDDMAWPAGQPVNGFDRPIIIKGGKTDAADAEAICEAVALRCAESLLTSNRS
jgi:hypothetical protein